MVLARPWAPTAILPSAVSASYAPKVIHEIELPSFVDHFCSSCVPGTGRFQPVPRTLSQTECAPVAIALTQLRQEEHSAHDRDCQSAGEHGPTHLCRITRPPVSGSRRP